MQNHHGDGPSPSFWPDRRVVNPQDIYSLNPFFYQLFPVFASDNLNRRFEPAPLDISGNRS